MKKRGHMPPETEEFDGFGAEPSDITEAQLRSWILEDTDDVVVLNKPGWVVCHPSKRGPFSSLVGAAREILDLKTVHLVSRLDRETSGLVILARHRAMASRLQTALSERSVQKRYTAIVHGRMEAKTEVSQGIGPDTASPIIVKQCVSAGDDARKAQTSFRPLLLRDNFTLVEVVPHTGRKHQIRVHAQWLGHPIVGDKLYGEDPLLYLDFVTNGWTDRHERMLPLKRQALHAGDLVFETAAGDFHWSAPLPRDMEAFWASLTGEESLPPGQSDSKRLRRRREH